MLLLGAFGKFEDPAFLLTRLFSSLYLRFKKTIMNFLICYFLCTDSRTIRNLRCWCNGPCFSCLLNSELGPYCLGYYALTPSLSGSRTRDVTGIKSPAQVSAIRRSPLAEIPANSPSSSHGIVFKSTVGKHSSITCSGDFHKSESEIQISNSRTISVFVESDGLSNPFVTPMKKPDCSILSDSFSTPSLLDDDFDESLLEEIDAVYEQKSATKGESRDTSISLHVETDYNDNNDSDCKTSSDSIVNDESVATKSELNHGDVLGSREEDRRTSITVEVGSMPDEYQKYLQSLNDKQREAACSDISVPLMIVAGPGSGKVLVFSLVYT